MSKPTLSERIHALEYEVHANTDVAAIANELLAIAAELERVAREMRAKADASQRRGAASAFKVDCYDVGGWAAALAPKDGA